MFVFIIHSYAYYRVGVITYSCFEQGIKKNIYIKTFVGQYTGQSNMGCSMIFLKKKKIIINPC